MDTAAHTVAIVLGIVNRSIFIATDNASATIKLRFAMGTTMLAWPRYSARVRLLTMTNTSTPESAE